MAPVWSETDSNDSGDDFELIEVYLWTWKRVVRGLLTHTLVRGFFGVLGNYLKEVKRRGLTVDP